MWKAATAPTLVLLEHFGERLPETVEEGRAGVSRGEFQKLLKETVEECDQGVGLVVRSVFELIAQKVG